MPNTSQTTILNKLNVLPQCISAYLTNSSPLPYQLSSPHTSLAFFYQLSIPHASFVSLHFPLNDPFTPSNIHVLNWRSIIFFLVCWFLSLHQCLIQAIDKSTHMGFISFPSGVGNLSFLFLFFLRIYNNCIQIGRLILSCPLAPF